MSKKDKGLELYRWSKEEFLSKKINDGRTLGWYKQHYRFNIKASFYISFLSLILVSYSCYKVKLVSDEQKTFITSTSGMVIQYEMTEAKQILLRNALNKINENRRNNRN